MTFTLKEADDMVNACAKAGVPLVGGATTTSHPSFGKAKELITTGAIGDVTSIEARVPCCPNTRTGATLWTASWPG